MAVKKAKILEKADVEQVLKVIEKKDSKVQTRDLVAFLLSLKAALRSCEIAGLKWSDVTNAKGEVGDFIHIGSHIAKNGEDRQIPMHSMIKKNLIKLRKQRPDDVYVRFGDYKGKDHISANNMSVWFHRLYRDAALEGCSSHSGRRTCLTYMARNANLYKTSLRDVQLLAGHAFLTTTERYIEPSNEVRELLESM